MDIEVKALTPDLIDDYLDFFDNRAFTDHQEWAFCYCASFCIEPEADKAIDEAFEDSDKNTDLLHDLQRETAKRLVKEGKIQGYLAYLDDLAVAFCNANDKQGYPRHHWDEELNQFISQSGSGRVKTVACFTVASQYRGRGVAAALMKRVIEDAAADGYEAVEGYPRLLQDHEPFDYTGPQRLYEMFGFTTVASCRAADDGIWGQGCTIMRKQL